MTIGVPQGSELGVLLFLKTDEFRFKVLMRIIFVLYSLPSHAELALQSIYGGVQQAPNKSVPVYLKFLRCPREDGIGLAVCWTLHNSLNIVSRVITGLRSKPLSQLVVRYMTNLPLQFHLFQEKIKFS